MSWSLSSENNCLQSSATLQAPLHPPPVQLGLSPWGCVDPTGWVPEACFLSSQQGWSPTVLREERLCDEAGKDAISLAKALISHLIHPGYPSKSQEASCLPESHFSGVHGSTPQSQQPHTVPLLAIRFLNRSLIFSKPHTLFGERLLLCGLLEA